VRTRSPTRKHSTGISPRSVAMRVPAAKHGMSVVMSVPPFPSVLSVKSLLRYDPLIASVSSTRLCVLPMVSVPSL
jgi:hypothetical protein